MKYLHNTAAAVTVALALGFTATALAQAGAKTGGNSADGKAAAPCAMDGMQHGPMGMHHHGPMGGMPHGPMGMQHGPMAGMQHGPMGGMHHAQQGRMAGMHHGQAEEGMEHCAMDHAGMSAAYALITPEERAAHHEQMRNATSVEERQKLAQAMHDEMQKRAKDQGITLPPHRH